MFQSISWSQFFTALAVVVVGYYVISSILLYPTEIISFVKGKKKQSSSDKLETESPVHESDQSIMGGTRLSSVDTIVREQRVESEDLIFSEAKDFGDSEEPVMEAQTDKEALLVGTVADLLQEIKSQAETIRGWQKDEVLALFREMISKYSQLVGTQYQEAINLFIINLCAEHVDWEFTPKELSMLWASIR